MASLRTECFLIFFCFLLQQSPYCAGFTLSLLPISHDSSHHSTMTFLCPNLHLCLSKLCKYWEKSGEILSDFKGVLYTVGFHSSVTYIINFSNYKNKKVLKRAYYFF